MLGRWLVPISFLILISFTTVGSAGAQNLDNSTNVGLPLNGLFSGSEVDTVQLNNGNLHIEIPLWSLLGRGPSLGFKYVYDSKGWYFLTTCNQAEICTDTVKPPNSGIFWRLVSPFDYFVTNKSQQDQCGFFYQTSKWGFELEDPDGTKHQFSTNVHVPCVVPSGIFTTYDGSGFRVELDMGGNPQKIITKSGTTIIPFYNPNNQWPVPGVLIQDSNGNQMVRPGDGSLTVKDTLGRTFPVNGLTYLDSNGNPQTIQITYSSVAIQTNLCFWSSADHCYEYNGTLTLPLRFTFPNGQFYEISYEQNAYGEPSSVTLPNGAQISWTWANDDKSGRRVAARTVASDGQISVWTYDGPTTVRDPLDNETALTWQGFYPCGNTIDCEQVLYVKERKVYNGNIVGGQLLRTTTTDYSSNGPRIQPIGETTILHDANLVSKVETDWDESNNVLERREFAFGTGTVGGLLRKTTFTYLHSNNQPYIDRNIADRVLTTIVRDSAGNIAAQTTNEYDNYTEPIQPTSAVQHDPTYNQNYIYRGNVTAVRRWRNTDGTWLVTRDQYEDVGNVVKTTDPGNHPTTFDYADAWANTACAPAGEGRAYLKRSINALGHVTSHTYYSCTGLLTSTTDPNLQTTTFTYDFMNRPDVTAFPDGGQIDRNYNDTDRIVTTKSLRESGSYIVNRTLFDHLGRARREELCEDESETCSASIKTDTSFDALGRKLSVSNPYRSTGDPTYGVTTFEYDALSRVIKVIPPDGTSGSNNVTTAYSGNMTVVTDQAGKQRRSFTDALGRLVEVDEPGGTSSQATHGSGTATVNGTSVQTHNITGAQATGWVSLSGAVQSRQDQSAPATQSNASVTVNGSEQSVQEQTSPGSAGSGSVTVNGSEQVRWATHSTGSVTVNGSEQAVWVNDPYWGCLLYEEFGDCIEWGWIDDWRWVYDSGYVSVGVNGQWKGTNYGQGISASSIAMGIANLINADGNFPATASVNGSVITLTSKGTGAGTNYSLSVYYASDYPEYFSPPSFVLWPSGAAMTGGVDTVYDSGTVSITVNGSTKSASYAQGGTNTSVASSLVSVINGDGAYPVSASLGGAMVYLTAKSVGAGTNYSLSASSSTNQGGIFGSPSFSGSASGGALTGGSDPQYTTTYDSGTVSVTVNGFVATANFGQGSNTSTVATDLRNTLNNNPSSPVWAGGTGASVLITSRNYGVGTNYPLSVGWTYNSTKFGSSSFTASPSGGTMTGGQDAQYTTTYDSGTVWITVNGSTKSASYGQGSTTSTIATALVNAINADGAYQVSASQNGATVNLAAKTAGTAGNSYTLSAGTTYNTFSFSQPSFGTSASSPAFSGGLDGQTIYDQGSVTLTIAGCTPFTVAYSNGSNGASVASALRTAIDNDQTCPVSIGGSGSDITLTADGLGSGTNYALSALASTNFPQYFASPSFTLTTSGMSGGQDATPLSMSTPAVTLYTYDTLDNLTRVDQKGNDANPLNWRTRTFTYNSLSQLLCAANPEIYIATCPNPDPGSYTPGTIRYAYDSDGNLLTKIAPKQNQTDPGVTVTTTFAYDQIHRLKQKSYSDGSTPTVTYGYDGIAPTGCTPTLASANPVGRRTGMCDAAGWEAWSFEIVSGVGWKTTDRRSTNGVTKDFVYQNNLDGSLRTLSYPTGRMITYGYDAAARAVSAVDSANLINYATAAQYSPAGALTSVVHGQTGSFGGVTLTQAYNARLQPTSIVASSTNGTVLNLAYGFNYSTANNGNVAAITNNRNSDRSQLFTYDELNRIKTAQTQATAGPYCWGETFGYDAWANLLNIGGLQPQYNGCTQENLSVSVDGQNHFLGNGYDAAGNMTYAPGMGSYTFNAENQITLAAGVTYTYDGDGRRVKKSNGKLYWYGTGSDPLAESNLSGTITDEYPFFDGKRIARRIVSSGQINYYFTDHLGSSRVVTDATGTILDDADFYPFGGERAVASSSGNAYKFTGKERDTESGLDFFVARHYSSGLGRFLSPDEFTGGPGYAFGANDPLPPGPLPYAEITNPQSLNKYTYTYNNPLRYSDPNGHVVDTIFDIAFIVWDLHDLIKKPNAENAIALGLDVVGAAVPFATGLGKGFKAAKALERAKQLEKAVELGKEGEKAAEIVKNTRHIESITGTAKFRVPDEITKAGIREAKNVKELSLTNQIKDYLFFAQKENKQLTLVIRKDTKLSKPLQELVDKGQIKLEYLK